MHFWKFALIVLLASVLIDASPKKPKKSVSSTTPASSDSSESSESSSSSESDSSSSGDVESNEVVSRKKATSKVVQKNVEADLIRQINKGRITSKSLDQTVNTIEKELNNAYNYVFDSISSWWDKLNGKDKLRRELFQLTSDLQNLQSKSQREVKLLQEERDAAIEDLQKQIDDVTIDYNGQIQAKLDDVQKQIYEKNRKIEEITAKLNK